MTHKVNLYISVLILALVVIFAVGVNMTIGSMHRYVVKVNGQEVKVDEFKIYMKIVKKEFEAQAGVSKPEDIRKMWNEPVEGSDPVERVRQNALDMVIGVKVIEQKAREMGVQLTDSEVNLLKEKIKSEGTLKEFGLPDNELLIFVKGLALSNKLSNFITKDVSVTDQELDKYIAEKGIDMSKEYNVRHILFLTRDENGKDLPKEKQEQALNLAKQVYEKAKSGEDFAKLAKEYSEDPGTKDAGGKYSFFKGQAVKEFEDTVIKLKPGEISEPVKTEYGYHIIKMESVTKPDNQEIDRVKREYKDTAVEDKRSKTFEDNFNKWKQKAKIEKSDKLIDSININEI